MAALSDHSGFTRPLKWLLLAVCIKIVFYLLYMYPDTSPRRFWTGPFLQSADHGEYIRPMDNYFERGIYAMDGYEEAYAGRMPGFVFPYMLFRAVFSEQTSHILLGIFILALAALASYTLSVLIYHLTQKRWTFILTFFLLNCIPFCWHYDWTLHTNSLSASATVFFVYFFYQYTKYKKNRDLLLAGIFLAWVAMLRGFYLVFIPVTVIYLAYHLFCCKESYLKIAKQVLIFCFPFLVFEGIWITRNYISLHQVIPFQTSFAPGTSARNPEYGALIITKYSMMKVRKLVFAWGGDNTWYFNNADIAWFVKRDDPMLADFKFDERIFFEGFTPDSLEKLKSGIIFSFERTDLNKKSRDSIEQVIETTAERYYQKFSENKKGYMYFIAPFKRLKNFLFKNVTQDWQGPAYKDSTLMQKGFKLLSLSQYAIILLSVLLFPLIYFFKKKDDDTYFRFIYLIVISNILPFMGLINFAHYSYFIAGYSLAIPVLVYCIYALSGSRKNG